MAVSFYYAVAQQGNFLIFPVQDRSCTIELHLSGRQGVQETRGRVSLGDEGIVTGLVYLCHKSSLNFECMMME